MLQTRKATLGPANGRLVPLSIASETVVARGKYDELLSHHPGDTDLSRAPLPLIVSHDTNRLPVGVVEDLHVAGRKLRGTARFGASPEADQLLADIQAGVIRSVSVGYQLLDEGRPEGRNGRVLRFRWQPHEVSIVSVPADPSVGFNRSHQGITVMENQTPESDAPEKVATRIAKIGQLYERFGGGRLANEYLANGGRDEAEFRARLLDSMSTQATDVRHDPAHVGMNVRERGQYSLVRAIRCQVDPEFAARNRGLESEVSQTLARQIGRDPRGLFVPSDIFFQRDLIVATSTMGGNLVATDLMSGSFVDVLRNRAVTMRMGATVLPGLIGNIAIPTKSTAATAYWVAEGTAPTEGNIRFSQLTMSPKTCGGFVDFTRKLLLQSAPAVEDLVRRDLADGIALAIDAAALGGAGTGAEPSGILTSTSVGTSTAGSNGGAPSWALMVALETAVANGNADAGMLGYVTNASVRGKLRTVAKSTSGVDGFVWSDDVGRDGMSRVAGYRAAVTNSIPANLTKGTSTGICSAAIFGDWSQLLIGQWGGLDVLVDPYTASSAGSVRVVAFADVDVAIRQNAAFAYIKDLLTT